jgi:uncharacterized membrane protein YfcA
MTKLLKSLFQLLIGIVCGAAAARVLHYFVPNEAAYRATVAVVLVAATAYLIVRVLRKRKARAIS